MNESSSLCRVDPPVESFDVWGTAPGRVEFIGNHTDYNGGWVLGATIDRRVHVTVTRREDNQIRLCSTQADDSIVTALNDIERQEGSGAWANYILGVLAVLRSEGLAVSSGFNLAVRSTLPVGAGLSSSAALELAAAFALTEMYDGGFSREELVRLCLRAENEFVGVPCGILDQAVVAFGDEDSLVRIDARTKDITSVPFPPETRLWIFQTHRPHSLAEAHYQERHNEARAARDRLDDLLGGIEHLVDVSPEQLEAVRNELPDVLYRRARHVSTEHRRVKAAVEHLRKGNLEAVGDLLFASHESSRTCYENSTPELDFIVSCLANEENVLGARLTGAGFGGAAMAWTRSTFAKDDAQRISRAYSDRFEEELGVLACKPAPGSFSRSHQSLAQKKTEKDQNPPLRESAA